MRQPPPKTIKARQRIVDLCEKRWEEIGDCCDCPFFRLKVSFPVHKEDLDCCSQSDVVDGVLRGVTHRRKGDKNGYYKI